MPRVGGSGAEPVRVRNSLIAGQLRDGGYRTAIPRTPLSVPGESVVIKSRNPARGSSGTGNHHPRKRGGARKILSYPKAHTSWLG
ncbi:hypothetical protein LY76DRAFT_597567 [Colletotrichum caudatum]|nr:hypothetical protein LY76DRAFT_597567 [Colletotrichum caudatum]